MLTGSMKNKCIKIDRVVHLILPILVVVTKLSITCKLLSASYIA